MKTTKISDLPIVDSDADYEMPVVSIGASGVPTSRKVTIDSIIERVRAAVEPGPVLVHCGHCHGWAAIQTMCVHCGAPVG